MESKASGVTESSAEENKFESRDVEIDNTESVSKCESTEVVASAAEVEVTEVVPSTSEDTLTKAVVSVAKREVIEVLKLGMNDGVESGSERKETEAESTEMIWVGEVEGSTCIQEEKAIDTEAEEQQEPQDNSKHVTEPLLESQMEEEEHGSGSQKTQCMDVGLIEPPVIFQDTAEKIPVAQVKEVVHDNGDSQKKECKDAEEADKGGSSEETYCSESSFQKTERIAGENIHIVLESDSEGHMLSEITGNLGVSQATTVDVADLEVPYSEVDMFGSQSQEDTDGSGELSETVTNYGDFVKGSDGGSQSLLQSSTTLSMDGSQDPSSKLETSVTKSTRKRKHEENNSSSQMSRLQWIVEEEDEEQDVILEETRYSKEGSSLGVHALPSSAPTSTSAYVLGKHKSSVPLMSPTNVILKEKEVQISPKANKQEQKILTSPKVSRRLIFETEAERQRPQLDIIQSNSTKNLGKVESETHGHEEDVRQNVTDVPSVQGNNDSSPEIEILDSKKSRQSIEVLFVSSHSHDSLKSTSQCEIQAGGNRASGGTVEVIDVDIANRKKDADSETEGSEGELFLRLSPSPSQKPLDFVCKSDKNSSSCSASQSADHSSYSSYKSSNAESLSSSSRGEFDTMKQDKKLLSGGSISKRYSVYTIQEEDTEVFEMTSQIQSSGSSMNSGFANGTCDVAEKQKNKLHSLSTEVVSCEGLPHAVDSCTTFSKVKDGAQIISAEQSQFLALEDSKSQRTVYKRKRDNGKQGIPIVNIVASDSGCDGHSTPVQKKARTDNGDVENGHEDTASVFHQKPSTLLQKQEILILHSTPQMGLAVTTVKEFSASSIEQDSTQGNEIEWEIVVKAKLKYMKENDKDVYRVQQCEDITEEYAHFTTRRLSDYSSSGGLADVSSKTTSPCSTISGPAVLPLPQNRTSLISMVSSSSTSSGGSSVAQGVTRHKYVANGGPFVMPKIPKDRSFRSEEGPSGISPGIHSPVIRGMDVVEKVFISSHPESSDRDQEGSAKADKGDSGRKSGVQKPGDESVKDLSVLRKTDDTGSANPSGNDAVPVPANVLKETPKSTVKQLKGRPRSSVKRRSLSRSFLKQNVESKRGRWTSARNRTPVTTSSVENVTSQIPKSGLNESSDTVAEIIPGIPEDISAVLDAGHLRPGASVFARWTDKKYYSGRLKEKSKDGRWVVLFDDGKIKSILEDFIIVVDRLSKGQLVYALAEDEEYLSGVIVNVQKKAADIMYSVELDDGDFVTVSRSLLFMTEDQAKILRETVAVPLPTKSPHHKADISLDNVLEGKRSRIGIREMRNKFDSAGPSGVSETVVRRKVSSPSLTESDTGSTMEDVDGVERESVGREIKLQKVKGQGRKTPRKNWGTLIGPIPPAGSKIFAGKLFLLTSSNVKQKYTIKDDSEGTDNQGTDYDEETNTVVFSKSYLTEQIRAGSGKLCDSFEDIPLNKYDSCYLISDRPNQTAKFILCLAYGIPIVSCTWIVDCCTANVCKPVTNHLLPVGWSLEKRDFVMKAKREPLSSMRIGVVSDTKNFLKFWELVLKGAGACVFGIAQGTSVKELGDLDVVVSNRAFPVDIQEQLEEAGKHIVCTAWVVQCLINGTKCPFT